MEGEMQIWSTALIPVPKWSYRDNLKYGFDPRTEGEMRTWSTALIPVPKWSYTEERRRSEVRLWSLYRSEATQKRDADLKYGFDPRTEVKL